jgi:hypothetical protein
LGLTATKWASPNSPTPFPGFPYGGENLLIQIQPQKLARETVDHVNVLAADVERARQSGVLDFADVLSVLVEDLNSLVLTVRHPQQALGKPWAITAKDKF